MNIGWTFLWILPLSAILVGCGEPRSVVFGDTDALLTATGINPGCEEATSAAEFSSSFLIEVDGTAEARPLLEIRNEVFEEGVGREFDAALTVDTMVGVDFCVFSSETEEDDDLLDDDLTEDANCLTIGEESTSMDFALEMSTGGCVLSASFAATVLGE